MTHWSHIEELAGIGLELADRPNGVIVMSVVAHGPAAGLVLPGSVIISMDGQPAGADMIAHRVQLGNPLRLTLIRPSGGGIVDVVVRPRIMRITTTIEWEG